MATCSTVVVLEGALLPEGPSLMAVLVERSGVLDGVGMGTRIAIKTSFMGGLDRRDRCPVVAPALLDVLVNALVERGAQVVVLEFENGWEHWLGGRDVATVAHYFGFEGEYAVEDDPSVWADVDLRIVFAKLASHPIDGFIGCRHGLGVLSGADYAFLDAFGDVGDGVAGAWGCAWPATPMRLYAGSSAEDLDTVVARDLGLRDEVTCEVEGIDRPIEDWRGPGHSRWSRVLCALAPHARTHVSGQVWLPRADSEVFPWRREVGLFRSTSRRLVLRLLGLHAG